MKNFLRPINQKALQSWGCGVIRLHTVDPSKLCLKFRLFGKTIATYEKGKKKKKDTAARVVYLKVNRQAPYTLRCIQSWLDALQLGGGGIQNLFSLRQPQT